MTPLFSRKDSFVRGPYPTTKRLLTTCTWLLLCALQWPSVSAAAGLSGELDSLDRAEFNEAIARARECLAAQDRACAEQQLAIAKRRAGSSSDKLLVERLRKSAQDSTAMLREQQAQDEDAVRRAQEQRRLQVVQARADEDAAAAADQPPSAADAIRSAGAQMNRALANQLAEKQAERERLARIERQQSRARDQQQAPLPQRPAPARQPQGFDQPQGQRPAQVVAQTAPAPQPAPKKPSKPVAETPTQPEALAFCWENKHGRWTCDGPGDETSIAEKDRAAQLSLVSCKQPSLLLNTSITLTSTRVSKRGSVSGWLFRCGTRLQPGDTGHATWNRDIRRFWTGIPG